MYKHILISLVSLIAGLIIYDHVKARKDEPEKETKDAPKTMSAGNGGDGYMNYDKADISTGINATHYNTLS